MEKYLFLMFVPVGIYFIAKSLRLIVLKHEREHDERTADAFLSVLHIVLAIAVLPISVIGFWLDSKFSSLDFKDSLALARFVGKAKELQQKNDETAQRLFANSNPQDTEFDFDMWVVNKLSDYNVYPEEVGYRVRSAYEMDTLMR